MIHFYHRLLSQCLTINTINFFSLWRRILSKTGSPFHNCFYAWRMANPVLYLQWKLWKIFDFWSAQIPCKLRPIISFPAYQMKYGWCITFNFSCLLHSKRKNSLLILWDGICLLLELFLVFFLNIRVMFYSSHIMRPFSKLT